MTNDCFIRQDMIVGVMYALPALEIDNTLGEIRALLAQYHEQLKYD